MIEAPSETPTVPYKGLTHYTEFDADFFFGREQVDEVIIANLKARRLTLLYGGSGVGKSSMLRAGVVAQLRKDADRDAKDPRARGDLPVVEYVPVVFSAWRDDPVAGLAAAITAAIQEFVDPKFELAQASRLDELIDEAADRASGYLLIVLDQFEEYFLYHAGEAGEGTFADEFVRALNRPGLAAGFLVSIREDALAKLDRFKHDVPKLFDSYMRVTHLDTAAAREAIDGPVKRYNELRPDEPDVVVEPALREEVLEQVRAGQVVLEQAGQGTVNGADGKSPAVDEIETPYLQLVMTRLWEEEMRRGSRTLRRRTLDELGGATEIVRTHLDTELSQLPPEERDAAIDIFHHLVTPSGTKIAHAVPDLAEYSRHSEAEVEALLEKLAKGESRIVRGVAGPPDQGGPPRFEIFHDVLATAILDWRTRQASERLKREKADAEQREENERRRARRFQVLLRVVGGLLVVVLGLGVVAVIETSRANDARDTAQSRQLAASSVSNLETDPELSALLALRALKSSHTPEAEEALRRAVPRLQVLKTFRTGSAVIHVAVSPRGDQILTVSADGHARTLNPRTGRVVRDFAPTLTEVSNAAFSPDGTAVVTANGDGTAVVWEAATGRVLLNVKPSTDYLTSARFSADGSQLATAGHDGTVAMWTERGHGRAKDLWARRPTLVQKFRVNRERGPSRAANSAELGPGGKTILTASEDGAATIWDARTGKALTTMKASATGLNSASFSPDARLVVTAGFDGTARIWDIRSGREMRVLRASGVVQDAQFSPDGRGVVTASDLGDATLWSAAAGTRLSTLSSHSGIVYGAALDGNGGRLVTGAQDGTVRIWLVSPPDRIGALGTPIGALQARSALFDAQYSVDGARAVTAAADGKVAVWDTRTGKTLGKPFVPDPSGITSVRYNLKGDLAYVFGNGGGRIDYSGTSTPYYFDARDGILRMEFAHRSRDLVVGYNDGTVTLFSPQPGQKALFSRTTGAAETIAATLSRDDRKLLTANNDGTVQVFGLKGRARPERLKVTPYGPRDAVFSPDERSIAVGGIDGKATVFDLTTRKPVVVLRAEGSGGILSIRFSPDGKGLLTATEDGSVRVWDIASRKQRLVLESNRGAANTAVFSPPAKGVPAGKYVLASYDDGLARIWSTELAAPIEKVEQIARKRLTRQLTPAEKKQFGL